MPRHNNLSIFRASAAQWASDPLVSRVFNKRTILINDDTDEVKMGDDERTFSRLPPLSPWLSTDGEGTTTTEAATNDMVLLRKEDGSFVQITVENLLSGKG